LELLAYIAAILGADNSSRNAALQESEWITDRKRPITNLYGIGIAAAWQRAVHDLLQS
jgi:hypothetical protein